MIDEITSYSLGKYADEPDSMAHFDRAASESGMFARVYSEVCGYTLQPRMGTPAGQGVRIDRIAFPSKALRDSGWPHGPIGIEGKTSNKKVGKVVSQALDYHASVFEYEPGYHIMLEWIFLWPFDAVRGDLASVMAQNRIGMVSSADYAPLTFKTDSGYMLRWTGEGIDMRPAKSGWKRGSR